MNKNELKENKNVLILLGLGSSLMVTTTVENSYIIGISIFIVLLVSSLLSNLIKKIEFPIYMIITIILVSFIEIWLNNNLPKLDELFNLYFPLIIINSIVLYQLLLNNKDDNYGKRMLNTLKIGVLVIIFLVFIGLIREVFGNNTITLMDKVSPITGYKSIYKIFPDTFTVVNIVGLTSGIFILVGFMMAFFKKIGREK